MPKFIYTLLACWLTTFCYAEWTTSPPAIVSESGTFTYADVASSCNTATGIFLATWVAGNNSQYPTYSFYNQKTGWTAIDTISTESSASSANVYVSCDPISGQFLATWQSSDTNYPTASVYIPDIGWSTPQSLMTSTAQGNVFCTYDSLTGQFLVTWSDAGNNNQPVYAFYDLSTGWGSVGTIPTGTVPPGSPTTNVYTTFDPNTNTFLAVWTDDNYGTPIYSFYSSGSWSEATFIASASVNNNVFCSCDPTTGQFIATWSDINISDYPFYSVYTPGIGWGQKDTITTLSAATDDVFVSYDSLTGQFLATWNKLGNGYPTYSFYTPSDGWSALGIISTVSTTGGNILTSLNPISGQFLSMWADNSNMIYQYTPTYSFFTNILKQRAFGRPNNRH